MDEVAALRSLWRDANFTRFWAGQTASRLGEQVTSLAIPVLAVLTLQASALEIGLLNAAETAAFLVVGLPAGVWIDRMRKRRVMIAADGVRLVALGSIPVMGMLGVLQIWQLIAVALVVSVASVFFDVSYQSLTPSLVPEDAIPEANGKLEATSQVAQLGGPALAGGLIGVITAPFAVVVTSGTYLISLIALLLTRDREQPRAVSDRAPISTEIAEGLRWVFGNPLLFAIVGCTTVSNLFSTVLSTLLPLFLLRHLGFSPLGLGLLLSVYGVGGVVGAALAPHIVRRLGEGPTIAASAVTFSAISLLVPIAATWPTAAFSILALQGFISSGAGLVYNVTQVSFRQRITPHRLLGRMNASIRFVVWGVMPFAALGAGALATGIGVVPAVWIASAGGLLSCLFVALGPFWRMRELSAP